MKFALAGNPNCGKTTFFNLLTGSSARVGNWAGVTVEQNTGVYKNAETQIEIIDLPGIYSLSPYTPEEIVSRTYITENRPNLIINIVDASNLERSLYLTTQLLETDIPVAVAVNMADIAEKGGIIINYSALSKLLGVPVMPVDAAGGEGAEEFMKSCVSAAKKGRKGICCFQNESVIRAVKLLCDKISYDSVFRAVKLLENDYRECKKYPEIKKFCEKLKTSVYLEPRFKRDFEAAFADMRYTFITEKLKTAFTSSAEYRESASDKADKILTGKYIGIPLFLLIILLIFHITFSSNFLFLGINSPGKAMQELITSFTRFIGSSVENFLNSLHVRSWLSGIINEGIINGVGSVLSFLPQILILFLLFSVLEDTGYMARGAFLMDRLLRKFGLSGKAFIPLIMGFGCSVPAIMGTRTLENEKEKRISILIMPFLSCGAKMPIWAAFSSACFTVNSEIIIFLIYFTGIFCAIICSLVLNKTLMKSSSAPFAMEIPPYRIPQPKSLALRLRDKMKEFLSRAATVVLLSSVIIWVLSNFSFNLERVNSGSGRSMIEIAGNFISPVFTPLGFGFGAAVVSVISGLIAKEMVISSLGVMLKGTSFTAALAGAFSPASAFSFMAFNLLSIPCMAATATAKKELGAKWLAVAIIFWIAVAYTFSFIIYSIFNLLNYR